MRGSANNMLHKTSIGGLLLLALVGCHHEVTPSSAITQTATARIVVAKAVTVNNGERITGTLHAQESAALAAQVMARVQRVMVREGDHVHAGQTLIMLDDASFRSGSDQAQAATNAAERQQAAAVAAATLADSTLARYRQLQADKSVSPQEMDEVTRRDEAARAQAEAAQAQSQALAAQAANAKTMLGYTRLTAPFDGVITARMVDPGAMAAPGVPLLQIDSSGPLELHADVPESRIAAIHLGMPLEVTVDSVTDSSGADRSLSGTVRQIDPAADPASHSFTLRIAMPTSASAHQTLRAGLSASAQIPGDPRSAVEAPRSAIVLRGSLPCVYALDANGLAQLRYLTLGATHHTPEGDMVEVLSGLSAGDRLVDSPADRDLAGIRIEAQP